MIELLHTSVAFPTVLGRVVHPVVANGALKYFHFCFVCPRILHCDLEHFLDFVLTVLPISDRCRYCQQYHSYRQDNVQHSHKRENENRDIVLSRRRDISEGVDLPEGIKNPRKYLQGVKRRLKSMPTEGPHRVLCR